MILLPTTVLALFLFAPQTDFQAQFVSGLQALNEHDLAAAQTRLQAANRLQPANPLVWLALAQTWWKLGKPALAADAAAKAEKFGAEDPVALRFLATYYAEQKKFGKAGDLEAKCAAKDAADRLAAARAMLDYLQADQPKKAIAMAIATPGWEGRADLRNLLGKAYEADGQILKTIPELQEAIRLDPASESYYFDLIQVLLNHYNFEPAREACEMGRKRFPSSAQIALATGVAYYGLNQPDKAIDSFLAAIDLDPNVEQPYFFLARLIGDAHDKLPAIERRAMNLEAANPRSELGYFLHAKALLAGDGDKHEAESLLRKSVAANGEFWQSHFELGILLMARGAVPDAEKEFRRATELNPTDPATHYRLFRALAALGKTQEAEAELARQRKAAAEYDANRNKNLGNIKVLDIPTPDRGKQ